MKFSIVLLVLIAGFVGNATANESNQPPVAIQTSDPSQNWFFESESVVFSSSSSYDPDGYIAERKWYINGVYQSASTTLSRCFVLFGTTGTSCYQLGSGATSVSIKLEVKDNAGEWRSSTVSYTIRAEKARRYFVTDHLGSVRTTVDRDGNVLGHDDYYPFGLPMPGRSVNTANPDDNYKFTGYEKEDEGGLNLYHANARGYDPVLGRFSQIDPMFMERPGLSAYNYVQNNPLIRIDPTGMLDDYALNRETGEITLIRETDDDFDVLYATDDEGNVDESKSVQVSKNEGGGSVLSELASGENVVETEFAGISYEGVVANTTNGSDARQVFGFAAENSNVEWSYQAYTDGSFAVSTAFNSDITTYGSLHSSNFGKTVAHDIHSHPFNTYKDLKPSGNDIWRAQYFMRRNPNVQVWLYVPKALESNRLWDLTTNPIRRIR